MTTRKSDKTLILDLSPSKDNLTRSASEKLNSNDGLKISKNSQIPVVYSKPTKLHKKVEIPNQTSEKFPGISLHGIQSSDSKQVKPDALLIEEM
jgi:hypothetical protein